MSTIAPPRPSSRNGRGPQPSGRPGARIGAYTDDVGRRREVVCLPGSGTSVLVLDRVSESTRSGRDDTRLVAHLAGDEPPENACIVAAMYLAGPHRGRCRAVTPADLALSAGEGASLPGEAGADAPELHNGAASADELIDRRGCVYRIAPCQGSLSIPDLRWRRVGGGCEARESISVRSVIGALERYEPVLSLTRAAVERHAGDAAASVALLRAEYERAIASPIVLNRGLREAVQRLTASGELTMSEVAIRCGRVRRGERGALSGETSWLARRIGLAPEPGHAEPTPWVHSAVLALIARGLCLSPNEVEV